MIWLRLFSWFVVTKAFLGNAFRWVRRHDGIVATSLVSILLLGHLRWNQDAVIALVAGALLSLTVCSATVAVMASRTKRRMEASAAKRDGAVQTVAESFRDVSEQIAFRHFAAGYAHAFDVLGRKAPSPIELQVLKDSRVVRIFTAHAGGHVTQLAAQAFALGVTELRASLGEVTTIDQRALEGAMGVAFQNIKERLAPQEPSRAD